MRQFLLGLSVSAVFVAGCVAGASNLAVPKARAAYVEEQRWAYFCFDASSADDVHYKANAAGARGWEMVSAGHGEDGQMVWCFRQPRP
ncbi:MAG TPA: hypothetical protein VJN18_08810 [Polyangiaceae bacterium]|nr:hypothetical protein [Polyangiaceae bacterium]